MITTRLIRAAGVAALAALAGTATAGELSADQVARLDNDLTPLGAIRAGNEAGTIPAWEGGIKSPADAGVRGTGGSGTECGSAEGAIHRPKSP